MDKDICTLLRETKAKTGWSEPRLAAELRVSQPTVNRILNGQVDCKVKTWRSIEALHASVFGADAIRQGPVNANELARAMVSAPQFP